VWDTDCVLREVRVGEISELGAILGACSGMVVAGIGFGQIDVVRDGQLTSMIQFIGSGHDPEHESQVMNGEPDRSDRVLIQPVLNQLHYRSEHDGRLKRWALLQLSRSTPSQAGSQTEPTSAPGIPRSSQSISAILEV